MASEGEEGGDAGRAQLWRMCEEGDEQQLKEWLDEAAVEVQSTSLREDMFRATEMASKAGHSGCVRMLLDRLAPCFENDLRSALDLAIAHKHAACVRQLIGAGAVPNPSRGSALLAACAAGRQDVAELLLNAGDDPNAVSNQGWAPLHHAVENNHLELAHLLLQHGANIDQSIANVGTAMDSAPPRVRDALRRLGVVLSALGSRQRMAPLHIAAAKTNAAMMRLLLNHGADVNARDAQSASLLYAHAAMMRLLLNHGADVNARDAQLRTPLHLLCQYAQSPVRDGLSILLQHGADVYLKDCKDEAPKDRGGKCTRSLSAFLTTVEGVVRHLAARKTRAADRLLRSKPHAANYAFVAACGKGPLEGVQWLAEKYDVNPNILIKRRRPLHAAVLGRQHDIVDWLLQEMGADPTLTTGPPNHTTSLVLACRCKDDEIAHRLLRHGVPLNEPRHEPCLEACKAGLQTVAWTMLRLGTLVPQQPQDWVAEALVQACAHGMADVASVLLATQPFPKDTLTRALAAAEKCDDTPLLLATLLRSFL